MLRSDHRAKVACWHLSLDNFNSVLTAAGETTATTTTTTTTTASNEYGNRLIYITADNEVILVTQFSSDRVLNLITFCCIEQL